MRKNISEKFRQKIENFKPNFFVKKILKFLTPSGMQIGDNDHLGGNGGDHHQFTLAAGEVIAKVYGSRVSTENYELTFQIVFKTFFPKLF